MRVSRRVERTASDGRETSSPAHDAARNVSAMERSVAAWEAMAVEAARSRPDAAVGERGNSVERASRRRSVPEPSGSGRYSHWNSPPGPRRRRGALRWVGLVDQRRGASRLSTARLRGMRRGRAPLRARHAEMTGPPTRRSCHAGLPDWPAGLRTGSRNNRPMTEGSEKELFGMTQKNAEMLNQICLVIITQFSKCQVQDNFSIL